ncbi:MAG: nickel pincer cofactor biosynthesis protein LarC [Lachnospiraceae bacterium]|nr:nickel pincer cofactor biosynthesis protein LarC [Lachnospiraceae bacterium]
MKTLYIDCGMGAAGDMLTAALLELLPDPDAFIARMNDLGIPGVSITREKSVKCGITGTHVRVTVHGEEEGDHHTHAHEHEHPAHDHGHTHEHEHDHDHEDGHSHPHKHHHGSMHEVEHLVRDHMKLPADTAADVLAVYQLIAEAESHVHGVPVTDIHFHEVGTMDALADITAVCLLMREIGADTVIVSPVHVGCGQVQCAHGILPVPAPATAYILKDVPVYGGKIEGELCTPTGAALLKYFATGFGEMPVMKTQNIGYGMGRKDFPAANCVRVLLGESGEETESVLELSCNVDDMSAEETGFAMERLFEGGALEVYTVPVGMKKSRPGTLLRVMCLAADREKMLELLFTHTTTIGVREIETKRYVLDRRIETLQTPFGEVRRKVSKGYGTVREKYEYEDLARIAQSQNMSLAEVRKKLEE